MTGSPHGSGTAGFSLVEMLVVLVILALVAAIGMPALRNLVPSQRLNATAEAIAGEVALLRTEALRTGRVTKLVFDTEANRFFSSRPGAPALSMAGWRTRVEPGPTSQVAPMDIRFLPDGGSTGARITVSGPSGARTLVVGRATGAIRRVEVTP